MAMGGALGTLPRDQRIANRVAIRVVSDDLVEQRRHIGRGAGIEERAIRNLAVTAQHVGQPINGLTEDKHRASCP